MSQGRQEGVRLLVLRSRRRRRCRGRRRLRRRRFDGQASILSSIRLFYWPCQPCSALTALFLCAKGFQAILLSAHVGRSVTILSTDCGAVRSEWCAHSCAPQHKGGLTDGQPLWCAVECAAPALLRGGAQGGAALRAASKGASEATRLWREGERNY